MLFHTIFQAFMVLYYKKYEIAYEEFPMEIFTPISNIDLNTENSVLSRILIADTEVPPSTSSYFYKVSK